MVYRGLHLSVESLVSASKTVCRFFLRRWTKKTGRPSWISTIKAKKPMRTSDGKNNIAQTKISKHLLVRLSRYLEYIWSLIALIKLCSLLIYRKCLFRGFVPIKAAALFYAEL